MDLHHNFSSSQQLFADDSNFLQTVYTNVVDDHRLHVLVELWNDDGLPQDLDVKYVVSTTSLVIFPLTDFAAMAGKTRRPRPSSCLRSPLTALKASLWRDPAGFHSYMKMQTRPMHLQCPEQRLFCSSMVLLSCGIILRTNLRLGKFNQPQ